MSTFPSEYEGWDLWDRSKVKKNITARVRTGSEISVNIRKYININLMHAYHSIFIIIAYIISIMETFSVKRGFVQTLWTLISIFCRNIAWRALIGSGLNILTAKKEVILLILGYGIYYW